MTSFQSFADSRSSREDVSTSKQLNGSPGGDPVTMVTALSSDSPERVPGDDLLLREMSHRWSNDLQFIVSLLNLQSRRATNVEVRKALTDAAERVSIVSHARKMMHRHRENSLDVALKQVCDALRIQAEIRCISMNLNIMQDVYGISERQVTTLCLVVNELITNAIKHAFADGSSGQISISIGMRGGREVTVTVDDDGCPLAGAPADGSGTGMHLVQQLMASIEGAVTFPAAGTKTFELRVPIQPNSERLTPRYQNA